MHLLVSVFSIIIDKLSHHPQSHTVMIKDQFIITIFEAGTLSVLRVDYCLQIAATLRLHRVPGETMWQSPANSLCQVKSCTSIVLLFLNLPLAHPFTSSYSHTYIHMCFQYKNVAAYICTFFLSGLSSDPMVGGIIFGIVIVSGCAIATCIVIILYKKRVRAPQVLSSSSGDSTSTSTVPPTLSTTNFGNQNLSYSSPPTDQTFSLSLNTRQLPQMVSPHLEAETHAGEAPPAYHTATKYPTVAYDYYKATQSTASSKEASDHHPSAPPAYSVAAGQNDTVYTVYNS